MDKEAQEVMAELDAIDDGTAEVPEWDEIWANYDALVESAPYLSEDDD